MSKLIETLKSQYPFFPNDIDLDIPTHSLLSSDKLHYLIFIPWDDKYFNFISADYRDFFQEILPLLSVRTTDVHTAVCLQYLDHFILKTQQMGTLVNRSVLAYSLILHDSGWSQMSQIEIAASLGVSGLTLNKQAMGPKEKHALIGAQIAKDLLTKGQLKLGLKDQEIDTICQAILYHDKPTEVSGSQKAIPIEVQLLVDLDHLWSFTHLNFWQDILRKGVSPNEYLQNLENDLDQYFVTEIGHKQAKDLLAARMIEVQVISTKNHH